MKNEQSTDALTDEQIIESLMIPSLNIQGFLDPHEVTLLCDGIRSLLAAPRAPAISESEDARDAARYRWLSRQVVATHSYDELICRWEIDYVLRGETFDEAIDAARAGGKS
jgi:hypothetical protein